MVLAGMQLPDLTTFQEPHRTGIAVVLSPVGQQTEGGP